MIEGMILPDVDDPEAPPFWAGCAAGELRVQACAVVRTPAHAAAHDVPLVPVVRRAVGRDVGARATCGRSSSPTRRCCPRTATRRRTTW